MTEEEPYYGKDCPEGMVQIEFVGVSPDLRYSRYGYKPSESAFIEGYVDGKRFRIDFGSLEAKTGKPSRGIHINFPFVDAAILDQCMNAVSIGWLEPDHKERSDD